MNTALRSYYLSQLGIDEWVLRKNVHAARIIIAGEGISPLLTTPEGRLLRRMLGSIGLDDNQVIVLSSFLGSDWEQDIAYRQPLAVMIFGETPDFLQGWVSASSFTLINLPSMTALFKYPGAKKVAWSALLNFQAYLVKKGLAAVNA